MTFSKRTALILLAAFVVLSIALRYPLVEHERYQADSYFIHHLSQSIVDEGRAMWTFNILSYVGYYPFSYPSGTPFLVAEISAMTGVSVESSILLLGMTVSIILCLAAFCLAREFLGSQGPVLLVTLLVVTGSRFVDTTCWVGSARGILVVVMLLSVMVAFRCSTHRNNFLAFIAVLLGIGSLSIHHMAMLYFFFGFALIMISGVSGYLRKQLPFRKRKLSNAVYIALAGAIAVVSFGYISAFGRALDESFTETSLFSSGSMSLSIPLNMAASYTNQIGFILPIAIIGIPYFIAKAGTNPKAMYPLAVLISFVPLLGMSLYVSMLIGPFAAIMGVRYLGSFLSSRRMMRQVLGSCLAILLIVSSIVLPVWSVDRWNDRTYVTGDAIEVSDEMVSDAAYLRYSLHDGAYVITNSIVYTSEMVAVANAPSLGSSISAVLSGDIDSEHMAGNVSLNIEGFPPDINRLLQYESDMRIDAQVYSLMLQGVLFSANPSSRYFDTHSGLIVIVDNNWSASLVTPHFTGAAKLPKELRDAAWQNPFSHRTDQLPSYMIYQSDRVCLYYVVIPTGGS